MYTWMYIRIIDSIGFIRVVLLEVYNFNVHTQGYSIVHNIVYYYIYYKDVHSVVYYNVHLNVYKRLFTLKYT